MAEKSIIIIGAGIAGLSAGCYGQMNDYRTRIFEMHDKPGGLCTTWRRKGYTIHTTHWLVGSGPEHDAYRFFEEVGAVQGQSMIDHETYARIEGKNGKALTLYTDIDRLEQHMLELAPEDKKVIAGFAQALHTFTRFQEPLEKPVELSGPIDNLKALGKMLPHMGVLGKWMGMTLRDFANEFTNPFLREAFGEAAPIVFAFDPDVSIFFVLITLASMHRKVAGYPVGGSLEFARAIERRYLGLGGGIHYKSPVAKILVKNDRAVGVRLVDGTEHRADIVISAADGRTTLFDMLDGKYIDDKIQSYYDSLALFPSIVHVSLGVDRSFEGIQPSVLGDVYLLDEPVAIAGREWKWLAPHVYNFDPDLAPAGKTLVRVMLASDYEHWRDLRQDRERYDAKKQQIADQVIDLLDRRFPGLAALVEMIDVATPVTFERYTGNWQGSYMGWLLAPKTINMRMSKTLPGLENFYMAGQWVQGCSLMYAVVHGRHVNQIICQKDKRPFVTTMP
jgi:phytoene dehydrogenase-like protein